MKKYKITIFAPGGNIIVEGKFKDMLAANDAAAKYNAGNHQYEIETLNLRK